jgi:hypothetical protein
MTTKREKDIFDKVASYSKDSIVWNTGTLFRTANCPILNKIEDWKTNICLLCNLSSHSQSHTVLSQTQRDNEVSSLNSPSPYCVLATITEDHNEGQSYEGSMLSAKKSSAGPPPPTHPLLGL